MRTTMHSTRALPRLTVLAFVLTLVAFGIAAAPHAQAQATADATKQAVITVQGMQCPFCAYGIKKHLAKLPGARKVEVELAKNQAIVTFARDAPVDDEQIGRAVRKAGFTPGKIEWRSTQE